MVPNFTKTVLRIKQDKVGQYKELTKIILVILNSITPIDKLDQNLQIRMVDNLHLLHRNLSANVTQTIPLSNCKIETAFNLSK